MILPGCEPKIWEERAWGIGKKNQVHGKKFGLLDLLAGSHRYLGKRDSERISHLYPGTSLLLLKISGNQGPRESHTRGWRTAKSETGCQRTGTHFVSDTRYFLKLL